MGFLRRSRPDPSRPATGVWDTSPDWAQPLEPADARYLLELVQQELGKSTYPDAAVLRDPAVAAPLALPQLVPLLANTPTARWPAWVHEFFEDVRARRKVGDAIEARSQTYETAADVLRIHWMAKISAPDGDVTIDGPVADTVEVLALDAGPSIRYVSASVFAKWGVSIDDAVRHARERVLALPLTRMDWASEGHPDVRIVSLEGEGPYAGALFHSLDRVDPSAVGSFGTLVGAPLGNTLIYRTLDASPDLRKDIVALSVLTHRVADGEAHGFLSLPIWRRPDGRSETVTFQVSDDGDLLDSHNPAFSGVLAALAPETLLDLPGWAHGILVEQAYTRFAGCVAAFRGVPPTDIGALGSTLDLATLARRCAEVEFEQWPDIVGRHVASIADDFDVAHALIRRSAEDPAAVRAHLSVWIASTPEDTSASVTQPLGVTSFSEVLGVYASESAVPMTPAAAADLGDPRELFESGRLSIRAALESTPSTLPFISGHGTRVTAWPSPTAAIPHLMTWLPDAVGRHGALVAVGDAHRLEVLPINDASVVLDFPAMLGLAHGAFQRAAWPIGPAVFWLATDRLEAIHPRGSSGVFTAIESSADLAELVSTLPTERDEVLVGLGPILGSEGSRRFTQLLCDAVVERLRTDAQGLTEIRIAEVRDVAGRCSARPADQWSDEINAWLVEMAGSRSGLDAMTSTQDYSTVRNSLGLRVDRAGVTGSELARDIGGGLAIYPTLYSGQRHRRVTHDMLEQWGVAVDRCAGDAATNTAADPSLVDEPMYADQPSARQIYATDGEREAVGTCLHLRYPGSRRGFVVSITHGSRAHYVRLDDPGAVAIIPDFARIIAGIYREADSAADAHSPWLFWLTPDGRLMELFDVLAPLPVREKMPPEFVAMVEGTAYVRPN